MATTFDPKAWLIIVGAAALTVAPALLTQRKAFFGGLDGIKNPTKAELIKKLGAERAAWIRRQYKDPGMTNEHGEAYYKNDTLHELLVAARNKNLITEDVYQTANEKAYKRNVTRRFRKG